MWKRCVWLVYREQFSEETKCRCVLDTVRPLGRAVGWTAGVLMGEAPFSFSPSFIGHMSVQMSLELMRVPPVPLVALVSLLDSLPVFRRIFLLSSRPYLPSFCQQSIWTRSMFPKLCAIEYES